MNDWLYSHIVFCYPIQILKSCKIIFILFNLVTSFVKSHNLLPLCVCCPVWLLATTWTVAHQAPLSIGFPTQEHWSGLPFPPLRDIPNSGIQPLSPESPAPAGRYVTTELPAAAAAKSLQSCPTRWDPIDGSPPGSPIPGILQARTLEWVAISFSNAWKWKGKVKSFNRVQLFATSWTTAYQAPPSMRFSRQEYWSGLPLPSPREPQNHNFALK